MKTQRRLVMLPLAALLCAASEQAAANIVSITEGQTVTSVRVMPGVVALCEYGVDALGLCQAPSPTLPPGEPSVFPGTFVSDYVIFQNHPNDPAASLITMCSDAEPCPMTASELEVMTKKRIGETPANADGVELTVYDPGPGDPGDLPGFFQTYNIISDTPTNDPVPVPTAFWLMGSGLLGLVGVARRKVQQY